MNKIDRIIKNQELELTLQSIRRLLVLIRGTNREIELSRTIKSDLMVRQAIYLKKQYTKELLESLESYQLPIQLVLD